MEIGGKELKKILDSQRKEYQQYNKVLIEDFDSKIKVLGEGILGIQEQLNNIREMVAKNTEDIEIIKMDISFIKNALKQKADKDELEALEKRVLFLEKKLKRI